MTSTSETKPVAKRGRGRPAGSKNKLTVLREEEMKKIRSKCAGYLATYTPQILEAMVKKAMDGDTRAATLILERTLPVPKNVDEAVKVPTVTINVTSSNPEPRKIPGITINSEEVKDGPAREPEVQAVRR